MRAAIFLDPNVEHVKLAAQSGCDRIELYTESFAANYDADNSAEIFTDYFNAAKKANELSIEVNAGHDLDLTNLAKFLTLVFKSGSECRGN